MLSCSNKAVSSLVFLFQSLQTWRGARVVGKNLDFRLSCLSWEQWQWVENNQFG